jgi:hypothetical protein
LLLTAFQVDAAEGADRGFDDFGGEFFIFL